RPVIVQPGLPLHCLDRLPDRASHPSVEDSLFGTPGVGVGIGIARDFLFAPGALDVLADGQPRGKIAIHRDPAFEAIAGRQPHLTRDTKVAREFWIAEDAPAGMSAEERQPRAGRGRIGVLVDEVLADEAANPARADLQRHGIEVPGARLWIGPR